ncbi:MAG: mechanosensitive ion channel [Bacteroidia bacterium]|nr:mechanosensitive ion channel [Bacteroidia bacterium]
MEQFNQLWENLISSGINLGKSIIAALVIYFVGRYVVKLINKLIKKMMERRKLDPAVESFLSSLVNITLTILLIIAVISALGIETTSFAALLASAGVAIGMALSGNLQNFAGGLIILLFKPYKIGDFVETQGKIGSVKEIQIFHTILTTADNKTIFIPNGSISSGVLTNFSDQDLRRVDWSICIEYGEDYEKAKAVIEELLNADKRVLKTPAYFIALGELAASSVNITIRAWVKSTDYWDLFFDFNKNIYSEFNKNGIGFPFPQITVHQAKN